MKTESVHTSRQSWPWIGQTAFGQAALSMLERGDWPATVLWSGPSSLGKATIARWLAQRDLCQRRTNAPCGKCNECQLVLSGAHPDCLLINGQQEKPITLEESQEAVQRLRWKTTAEPSRRRWVLLLDVEGLSEAIGNSILKLIEEPPPHTTVIMTSSHPDKILPTIRSRAIEFRWHRVPQNQLDEALTALFPAGTPNDRRTILRQAAGRPGLALRFARRPEILEEQWSTTQALLRGLQSGRWPVRRDWTADDLDQAEGLVRDALLVAAGGSPRRWVQYVDSLQDFSRALGLSRLRHLAAQLALRQTYLRQHVQPSFILHDLSF